MINKIKTEPTQQLTLLMILVLGAIAGLTPLAIDMYLPAMPAIANELMATPGQVQSTLAAYTAGFAIGQLLYGPISDSYGRRPVLLIGVCLFLIASVACATSNDIMALTYVRAAQGFFGAAAAIVIQALVRDMFDKDDFARTISFITLVMTIAPLIAPMIGGYLAIWLGWRSIFWAIAAFTIVVIVLVLIIIPETLPEKNRHPLRLGSSLRNYMKILRSKESISYILASGFSFAGMFSFLTAGSFVYIDYYGVSTEHFAYLFGLNILFLIVMTTINGRYVKKIGAENMLKIGLMIQLFSGLALIVTHILELGLWGTVIPVMCFVGTNSVVGSNTMACVLSSYPKHAGTASSLAGTMRFGIGTIIGTIVASLHVESPWPMAIAMASCGVLSSLFYWCISKKNSDCTRIDNEL